MFQHLYSQLHLSSKVANDAILLRLALCFVCPVKVGVLLTNNGPSQPERSTQLTLICSSMEVEVDLNGFSEHGLEVALYGFHGLIRVLV